MGRLRRRHALLGLLAWCRPAGAEPLTLEALLATLAAVPERRASFVEERRFGALDQALESRGTLSLRRGRMEKVTDWPQPERLEIDGDRVVMTLGNEPPRVIELGMAPELRVLVDAIRGPLVGDVAALRRAFDARVTGTPAGWTLTLRPRDASGAKLLRDAVLTGHGDQVDRLVVTQANGDSQAMTIRAQ
jgi:hypothetical protein